MSPFRTILAAVDFSEASHDAVRMALELAQPGHTPLHLIHVVNDPLQTPWAVEAAGIDFQEVQRAMTERAQQQLVELAASHNLDPLGVTTGVVVGSPAAEIVAYANEHGASVIVLGSHGHGIVRRFLLGSVAERVIRQANCPVLIVPHRTLRLTPFEVKAASGVES